MRNIKPNFLGIMAVFVTVLSVSACTSILPKPKPAPTIYRLSIPVNASTVSLKNSTVVNIELPQAPRALSGTDIVLSPNGRRLTAAASASWAEPVPSQVRQVLVDVLAANKRITGVIPKGGTRVPYRLNMQIRRFEAEFDNGIDVAPNAIVHINVTLTHVKFRRLVGVYSIRTNARASSKTVSSIVEAQDKATREAMNDISSWLNGVLDDKN
ncbi:MAG: hypothetical protein COB56_03670 [Robiginitomaculum sp.]|nr:MAG: hypothetical protein COB56_03670 [Robiginitomaculum sp.]